MNINLFIEVKCYLLYIIAKTPSLFTDLIPLYNYCNEILCLSNSFFYTNLGIWTHGLSNGRSPDLVFNSMKPFFPILSINRIASCSVHIRLSYTGMNVLDHVPPSDDLELVCFLSFSKVNLITYTIICLRSNHYPDLLHRMSHKHVLI